MQNELNFQDENIKIEYIQIDEKYLNDSSTSNSFNQNVNCYLFDGEYYKIIRSENDKIFAKCCLCNKRIVGNKSSTGNFLTHYRVNMLFLIVKYLYISILYILYYGLEIFFGSG